MASNEETVELLQTPLRQDVESGSTASEDVSEGESDQSSGRAHMFLWFVFDLAASAAFWYVVCQPASDLVFYGILAALALAMLAWRIYRAYFAESELNSENIPYTAACVQSNGKELFLVATVHISPRAPKDVELVINNTKPDITMIELDEERLDRMREAPPEEVVQEPKPEDLQQIMIKTAAAGQKQPVSMQVRAQRALWNAEGAGKRVSGEIIFDEDDEYGLGEGFAAPSSVDSYLALVRRGGPEGEWAPFALKAHKAARAGASAVLVVNSDEKLPLNRIGGGTLRGDLRVACATCNCGFPSVPVLLLPKQQGEQLIELAKSSSCPTADFEIMQDLYPRRSLAGRLCQNCALIFSGIGVLYGVIQLFAVEVGGEFLAAEIAARANGIRCVCIDVDLNRFWSRLGWALLPTPCNLANSLLSWLAFPRLCFQFLFPPRGSIDVFGGMILHGASFSCKTWVAFILAGVCASFITNNLLKLLGSGAERGAEEAGVVKEKDRDDATVWIMLAIELYMLPQIYDAVAASRDEAMYERMVRKCREFASKRMVVVVGAGHSNGILQRVRSRGL
eukprot:TRINITY_DN64264_c0_g1_i1.p1 TRINITY_DN64264_c0_g1~~TRINITY_DN64264_c0_g1_i1.p1  ORF type:complete len:566 (+),score=116.08 TRINITY_DN64264_c0_g1_i1:61-1758(+)